VVTTTDFELDASVFNRVIGPGSAGVVVGSSEHIGKITVFNDRAIPFAYDLTLQNGRAGSAGILLASGLSNPGRQLTLSSGNAVTQGGPVSVGSLLLHDTQPQSRPRLAPVVASAHARTAPIDGFFAAAASASQACQVQVRRSVMSWIPVRAIVVRLPRPLGSFARLLYADSGWRLQL
jgi:hypothetical protein